MTESEWPFKMEWTIITLPLSSWFSVLEGTAPTVTLQHPRGLWERGGSLLIRCSHDSHRQCLCNKQSCKQVSSLTLGTSACKFSRGISLRWKCGVPTHRCQYTWHYTNNTWCQYYLKVFSCEFSFLRTPSLRFEKQPSCVLIFMLFGLFLLVTICSCVFVCFVCPDVPEVNLGKTDPDFKM